jgi:glucokinase
MANSIIAVDLGGTRLRSARLNDDLDMFQRHEILTHAEQGVDAVLGRVVEVIRHVLPTDGTDIDGIGISIPGPTNPFTGIVELGTNLPGWQNVPLARIIKEEFNAPVYLGNDANVAALAEVARGAARGARHAIFITVSTGIGGGVVVDGRMLLGKRGYAAELGHVLITVDGRITTLEKEAAGPALARQARERIGNGEKSIISEMVEGDLSRINGGTVGHAAQQGDAMALKITHRAGTLLGLGVTSFLHIFNPEVIIFGGGVTFGLGELLLAPMRDTVQRYAIDDAYYNEVRYALAELGENVSIIGAGALVATHGGVDDVAKAAKTLAEDAA